MFGYVWFLWGYRPNDNYLLSPVASQDMITCRNNAPTYRKYEHAQFHSGTGTQWHLIADCWQSKTRDSYCHCYRHHSRTTCTSWLFWTLYKCVPKIITVITLTEQLNCVVQNKNATVGHGWLVQTCDVNWFHSVSSPNQLDTAQCSAVDCVIMPSSIWNYGLMH